MALTAEKQTRLEELQTRRVTLQDAPESTQLVAPVTATDETVSPQGVQAGGLSPEKQARLDELQARRQGDISPGQVEDRTKQLFEQLGGRLPSEGALPPAFRVSGLGASQETPFRAEEQSRREAFSELQNQGFTPQQISLSLQTQKALGAPRIGRTVGGIGGALATTAIAGRFIPGPVDDAAIFISLLASIGAGTGGVAGEAAQVGIEEKRLISKGEALIAFATESLTEFGGRGVVHAGKFVLSPFIKRTVPEAAALVDDFAKVGGTFSPSELDSRFALNIEEAFSRGSFGAKKIFQEFEEKQGAAVAAFADNIIENIGKGIARQTPEEIGETFAQGITRPGGRVFNIFDDLVNPLYKQVDDLTGKATVSTGTLKSFAQKHLATDKRLNSQFLSPTGRSKLEGIVGLSDNLSFSDMRTLRSSFLKDSRKLARDVDQSQGIIKQLSGITDKAIFDPIAAKELSPGALNLLRNTNALYKAGQEGIKSTFSESLAKRLLKNPSNVVKELFPANNPKSIRLLRQSLVEPISGKPSAEGKVVWNQLRQAWLADAVDQATKEGVAKPQVFNRILRKLGPDGLKEMFPEKQVLGNVRKIQNLFDLAGKGPPAGTSLFSRGAQIGGLAMMYNSGKEGDFIGFTAGGVLAVGPLAFAKLATSPQGVKFLTRGLSLKPGASALVPNTARMIKLLRQINSKEQRSSIRREKQAQQKVARGVTERKIRSGKFRPTPPVQPRQFPRI